MEVQDPKMFTEKVSTLKVETFEKFRLSKSFDFESRNFLKSKVEKFRLKVEKKRPDEHHLVS